MKKSLSFVLVTLVLILSLAGCKPKPVESTTIRIAGLRGPTSMGLVRVMEDADAGTAANDYEFVIAGSADEVVPKLVQGEFDMAAVPANLASVLYNNTDGAVKLVAINTLGVIYVVEKGEQIHSFEDLRGKTIYASGKGSTPEYTFLYLLSQAGIDPEKDVSIQWKSEPTEVVAILSETEGGIAVMPQPYVTVAMGQVEGLRVALDFTEEWDRLENGSTFITGVLVARSEFLDEHPQEVAAFLDEYEQSAAYVNANPKEAAQLIDKFNIVKADVAEKAIPLCHITFIEGSEMKPLMDGYLGVLFEQNAKSVGGALPGDDFYYERSGK